MPAYGGRRTRAGRPRARRTLVEGGTDPRARRSLLEGERSLERGGPARGKRTPSNGTDPARGRRASSCEAKPVRGDLQEGRLGGPLRSLRYGPYPAWLGKVCLALLRVLSGDFPIVKGDPLGCPRQLRICKKHQYATWERRIPCCKRGGPPAKFPTLRVSTQTVVLLLASGTSGWWPKAEKRGEDRAGSGHNGVARGGIDVGGEAWWSSSRRRRQRSSSRRRRPPRRPCLRREPRSAGGWVEHANRWHRGVPTAPAYAAPSSSSRLINCRGRRRICAIILLEPAPWICAVEGDGRRGEDNRWWQSG
jgi:hypothetical protein